jgi:hypothetical protein
MDYWTRRGYTLKGTRFTGIWIASRRNQHAVLRMNFFDELVHVGAETGDEEFFYSESQAVDFAKEVALASV